LRLKLENYLHKTSEHMSHYYTDDSIQQLAGNQKIYHQKLNLKIINLLIKFEKRFLKKNLNSLKGSYLTDIF